MFKKSKKQYIIILIILISFLNICESLTSDSDFNDKEITIKIDFLSNIDYQNVDCGCSIIEEDSKQYPPCKTFYDAGERSRQLFENNSNLNQMSLVLLILNLDPNKTPPTINLIGEKTFGDLKYYCSFNIDFQDTNGNKIEENENIKKKPLLIIDGKSVSRSFIKYVGFENNTLCNKKLISINNLLFKDWGSTLVFSNSLLNKPYHSLDFFYSSITTIGSFKIVESVEANYTEGDLPANFIFKDCHFTNVTNQYQTPLFYMYYNNISLVDTIIDNMKLVYSPFFLTMSTFVMENSIINNVEVLSNDDLPIINMNGFVIQFYNLQFSNNKISTFFKGYFPKRPSQPRDPNIFKNCLFNNNIISTSPNSFIMISLFQIMDSIYLSFENSLFLNNTINGNKTFLSIDKSYHIKFNNSTISNQFSSGVIIDNGFIDLKSNSRINTLTTIKGKYNLITVDKESASLLNLDKIKKDCFKCNYIISNLENSDNSDSLNTKNYKIHNIDKEDLIKKVIVPVLICSISISILVLVIVFRKNIKSYFKNRYSKNNDNNSGNNSVNNNSNSNYLSNNIIEYEYGESGEGLFSNQTSCDNPFTCPSTSGHIDHISVLDKNNDTPQLDNNL
ncbi:hypothetical protein ACTA71_006298 [Dictyostelium dimigraforme]